MFWLLRLDLHLGLDVGVGVGVGLVLVLGLGLCVRVCILNWSKIPPPNLDVFWFKICW